jgi:hypothetical protein
MIITEAEARRIHWEDSQDITHDQAVECDKFVRQYTLHKLKGKVNAMRAPVVAKDFLVDMVNFHYGSVEVDQLLVRLDCYPPWIKDQNA